MFDFALQANERLTLLERQVLCFRDANAMLATEGAAKFYGRTHQHADRAIDGGPLLRFVPYEVDVQVSVSGVPISQMAYARRRTDLVGAREKVGNSGPGDHDVLAQLVAGESACGLGQHPASSP